MADTLPDSLMNELSFAAMVSDSLQDMKLLATDDGSGFLLYREWADDVRHVSVPVWAYDANDRKTAIRLFQKLASATVTDLPCEFSINLYHDDVISIQAFCLMQFGIMSETCIRKLEADDTSKHTSCQIRTLTKPEIAMNWDEVWNATHQIIIHLQESPVFYPGTEFTEEVYRDFYMDEGTHLLAAYDQDRLAGIMEWNAEPCELLPLGEASVNVGEAYVFPEYRGSGLAEQLLRCAEKEAFAAGNRWMWVQHGTANPNACGFWNKYFQTCQYELVRRIEIVHT
ncbi:MAG: GNAT family N-acetyltransferase [Clostridia bacterium]|nr:GNAT family N-acetyltransferase [Clostridia bacterium]